MDGVCIVGKDEGEFKTLYIDNIKLMPKRIKKKFQQSIVDNFLQYYSLPVNGKRHLVLRLRL